MAKIGRPRVELPMQDKAWDRCPRCKSKNTRQSGRYDVGANGEYVERYHFCTDCGQRFKTRDQG